ANFPIPIASTLFPPDKQMHPAIPGLLYASHGFQTGHPRISEGCALLTAGLEFQIDEFHPSLTGTSSNINRPHMQDTPFKRAIVSFLKAMRSKQSALADEGSVSYALLQKLLNDDGILTEDALLRITARCNGLLRAELKGK